MISNLVTRPSVLTEDEYNKKRAMRTAKELEIESIESPTRPLKKPMVEPKKKILPSKQQLKTMAKEVEIAIKQKLRQAPKVLERGARKIGTYAKEKIKSRINEEIKYRKALGQARAEARQTARYEDIPTRVQREMTEEKERRMTAPKMTLGFSMPSISQKPLFEKRKETISLFEMKPNTRPMFLPRKMGLTGEVATFKPRIMTLTPKLDITSLPKVKRPMLKKERFRL